MLDGKVKAILEAAAEASSLDAPTPSLLSSVWETLVGEAMARRTRPGSWSDGTLTIIAPSESWIGELKRHRGELMARIDARLPWTLEALDFAVGDVPSASAPPRPDPEGPSEAPISDADVDATLRDDLERLPEGARELSLKIREHLRREAEEADD